MSELFNRKCSIPGKIPSGSFNAMFGFQSGCWAMDAVNTKCLGLDGYFISLFNAHIDRYPLRLSDQVRSAVPSSWDPPAIARYLPIQFIQIPNFISARFSSMSHEFYYFFSINLKKIIIDILVIILSNSIKIYFKLISRGIEITKVKFRGLKAARLLLAK